MVMCYNGINNRGNAMSTDIMVLIIEEILCQLNN